METRYWQARKAGASEAHADVQAQKRLRFAKVQTELARQSKMEKKVILGCPTSGKMP